ncbi:MAG: peptidoglycan editing factor PgeF [Acidobacteriia bacterium]|nr:peptidoglycan editing factor PgeF [Terriglobia bacterium]
MFYKDSSEVYRVPELDALPWLLHGFGTRHARLPENLTTLKQIHSSVCIFANGRTGNLGEGDALLDNAPGAALAIRTADCVPILLVDKLHHAVAAVHAGWRGTAAGIVQRAVGAMKERFGSKSDDLHAALGPGIGECCYEVGPEVAAQFGYRGRAHLDLGAINRRQLLAAGLPESHIYAASLCTMCLAEFHSYRRDREAAGRNYSFAGIVTTAAVEAALE